MSLSIYEVQDIGVPNLERIAIRVDTSCDIGDYCLLIGHQSPDGTASPIKDHMLWFGRGWVNHGDWLFVYSGPGQTRVNPIPNSNNRVFSIYWGKEHTVFQNRALLPMLCKLTDIALPPQQQALPQTMLPTIKL